VVLPGVWIAAGLAIVWMGRSFAAEPSETPPPTSSETASPSAESTPPDPAGVWAQKLIQTSLSNVAIVGEVETVTTTYLRTTIERNGDSLSMSMDACESTADSDTSLIQTEFPKAFLETLGVASRPVELVESEEGWRLIVPRHCDVRGAELRSPAYETLPTSSDDPRVTDADDDGKPGVTIEVEGIVDGKMYIVHRACDRFRGRFVSSDRIEGRVEWEADQEVLGSTSLFLRKRPETRAHSDASKNRFTMVRVPDGAGCETILSERETLF
jgi:hypothetical protein